MPEAVRLQRGGAYQQRREDGMNSGLEDRRRSDTFPPALQTIVGDDLNQEHAPALEAGACRLKRLGQLGVEPVGPDARDARTLPAGFSHATTTRRAPRRRRQRTPSPSLSASPSRP